MKSLIVHPSSGQDQSLPVKGLEAALKKTETEIRRALKSRSPEAAFNVVRGWTGIGRISGVAAADALWHLQTSWKFDDDFYEVALEQIGLANDTIDRYLKAWAVVEYLKRINHDRDVYLNYVSRPMTDLIAVGQFSAEYGFPSKAQMKTLYQTDDGNALREALIRFKGRATKNNGRRLVLQRDGTLEAWYKGQVVYVGFLDVAGESDHPDLRDQAIQSLIKRSRIKVNK